MGGLADSDSLRPRPAPALRLYPVVIYIFYPGASIESMADTEKVDMHGMLVSRNYQVLSIVL